MHKNWASAASVQLKISFITDVHDLEDLLRILKN